MNHVKHLAAREPLIFLQVAGDPSRAERRVEVGLTFAR